MSPSRAGSLTHHLVYTGLDICVLCKNHRDLCRGWHLNLPLHWDSPQILMYLLGSNLFPVANLRPSVLCVRSPEAHLTWDWEVIRSGPNYAGSTVSVWEGTGSLTSLSC